jgi:hypothetical protein
MTARDLALVLLKVMGLYYALTAGLELLGAIAAIGHPPTEPWPESTRFVVAGFASALVQASFAFLLLSRTDSLVRWLIEARGPTPARASRRDLLVVALTSVETQRRCPLTAWLALLALAGALPAAARTQAHQPPSTQCTGAPLFRVAVSFTEVEDGTAVPAGAASGLLQGPLYKATVTAFDLCSGAVWGEASLFLEPGRERTIVTGLAQSGTVRLRARLRPDGHATFAVALERAGRPLHLSEGEVLLRPLASASHR